MKKLSISLFTIALLASGVTYAQNYYSRISGAWNNNTNVWSITSNTGSACSCNPGTTVGVFNSIYIYNTITASTVTGVSGGGKIVVESGDSLTITTSTFAVSGTITVNTGGVLIFNANVNVALGGTLTNNGTIIINTNLTSAGTVRNNGTMYVYGNVTVTGLGSFGGTGMTYATGTVSGSGTSIISVLPAFFSSFTYKHHSYSE